MATSPLPDPTVNLLEKARRSEIVPEDFTDADLRAALLRYRRFLRLVQLYPGQALAPTHSVDIMWHLHMLSPQAYYNDCMRLFGGILDHDGGFGQTPDEEPQLIACFERTAARYEATFGESFATATESATKCWHDCQGRCWHACKSVGEAA